MSSRLENNSQEKLTLEELMDRNTEKLEEYRNIPTEVRVYMLPEKQRSIEVDLLTDVVNFQPKIYRKICELATKQQIENISQTMVQKLLDENRSIMSNLISTNASTVAKMENLLQQDGSEREKYILHFSNTLNEEANKLSRTTDMLKRHLLKFLGITVGAATLFSTLVSVLLQLWLR